MGENTKEENNAGEQLPELPSPTEFYLNIPLYRAFPASQEFDYRLSAANILYYKGTIDSFCIWCEKESVFYTSNRNYNTSLDSIVSDGGPFNAKTAHHVLECRRNSSHTYSFYISVSSRNFGKIGQFPSLADLQVVSANKYKKSLPPDEYAEFIRGIGLCAHGVGIGSFVYLRRVFEFLIEEAHEQAKTDPDWDESAYSKERMAEKIARLIDHLPPFLVENTALYSIMSKGLHELSEQDCLKYFPGIRASIEIILDQKLEIAARQLKEKETKEALQDILNNP